MWKAIAALAIAAFVATTGQPARAEPVKIRVSWVAIVTNMPSIMMLKPDLMRHNGKSYVFDALHFNSTPLMTPALATGDLDIATFAYSSFAAAVTKAGISDLRIIADEIQDGVPGYYTGDYFVRKDSPIHKVEDLKGKILATSGIGGAMDVPMRLMLKKHGLDEKKDVTIIEVGMSNQHAVLLDGKVDLITSPLPFSADPQLRAKARTLFTQYQAAGKTQMIVWAARTGFIEQHRAALVDLLEDTIRERRWFADPAHHAEMIKLVTGLTKQPADRYDSWLFTKHDYYRDPDDRPDLKAMQSNLDALNEMGLLADKIDVAHYADLSLVKAAAARVNSGK